MSKKILLVEDDDLITNMYAQKLESDGYEVHTAVNGSEGMELMRRVQPDLVLCDVMMPEMNGFELLQAKTGDPELAAIPIIMLTNLKDEQAAAKIEKLGVEYLIKGEILPKDIVSKVEQILN